ncbi:MAG: ribulose-phosphate 3-epimerase [Prevotellaceae bacterium]|nr:ribulose-phosphate 3-epimerase [Prevotellaceae bacterium]
MNLLSVSLLAADFGFLARDVEMVNLSEADWFHIDVMDGVFVPNISFGFPVMKAVKKCALKPLDVHLMITKPELYLDDFKDAGAEILTVHYETCPHLNSIINKIKSCGMKAGLALNPHTPVNLAENIIHELDLLLVMSVNPGFGGQKFIDHSLRKIEQAKELIIKHSCKTLIEVDGGIDAQNASQIYSAGADVLVAGNAIFSSPNQKEYIQRMKNTSKR